MSEAGIRIRFQLSFFISNLGCTTGRLGPCGIHIMGQGARPFREVAAVGGPAHSGRWWRQGGARPFRKVAVAGGARAFREVAAARGLRVLGGGGSGGGGPTHSGRWSQGGGPAHSERRWRGKWSNPLHWRRDGRRVIEDVTIHFAGAVKKN